MAKSNSNISEAIKVELTGDDIPGTTLRAPFADHKVPALKWWLLCREINAPSSWKKPKLVARYSVAVHTRIHQAISEATPVIDCD